MYKLKINLAVLCDKTQPKQMKYILIHTYISRPGRKIEFPTNLPEGGLKSGSICFVFLFQGGQTILAPKKLRLI